MTSRPSVLAWQLEKKAQLSTTMARGVDLRASSFTSTASFIAKSNPILNSNNSWQSKEICQRTVSIKPVAVVGVS